MSSSVFNCTQHARAVSARQVAGVVVDIGDLAQGGVIFRDPFLQRQKPCGVVIVLGAAAVRMALLDDASFRVSRVERRAAALRVCFANELSLNFYSLSALAISSSNVTFDGP